MNTLILLFFLLFILSFVLTITFRYYALKIRLLDIPNARSSHSFPIPKGGGIAIVIAWYLGISVLNYLDIIPRNLYFALMGGIILAVIGFVDDIFNLNPSARIVAQIFTAAISLYFLGGVDALAIGGIEISSWYILLPVALTGIIWFINLFNFLDGIDGYASLEASTISILIYSITGHPLCLILLASILGFLSWNWPKAKIFMGDVGSTQLGFILIIIGIYFHNESSMKLIHWIMISSLFWFDATFTLLRRWFNKENLSIAHKKHAYQRAVQSGLSHLGTILYSFLINIIIAGFVYLSIYYTNMLLPMFILNMLLLYGITIIIDNRIPFK